MESVLSSLSITVSAAQSLEQLTRPLLRLLSQVTGMESTFLTTVHLEAGVQRVEFAYNAAEMEIAEGLSVDWGDTLCRRALEEGSHYCGGVAAVWGDSKTASSLGIQSYFTAPIHSQSGRVLGTLCAASANPVEWSARAESLLILMSGVLGFSLERELLFEHLQQVNSELKVMAMTDDVTGLPNRRAIFDEMEQVFAQAVRDNRSVLVGVIDLDGFKRINDAYGHLAGDELILAIAERLKAGMRAGDIIGRAGGDEFIVVGLGPAANASYGERLASAVQLQERLAGLSVGCFAVEGGSAVIDYAGASTGVVPVLPGSVTVDQAVRLADAEMYRVKHQRRRG